MIDDEVFELRTRDRSGLYLMLKYIFIERE